MCVDSSTQPSHDKLAVTSTQVVSPTSQQVPVQQVNCFTAVHCYRGDLLFLKYSTSCMVKMSILHLHVAAVQDSREEDQCTTNYF